MTQQHETLNDPQLPTLQHPLDYAALNKGEVIPVSRLEAIFGFRQEIDWKRFQWLTLGLRSDIEAERGDLVVVQRDGALVLLTDPEIVEYLRAEVVKINAKIKRIIRRGVRADDMALTGEDIKRKEYWLRASARMLETSRREVTASVAEERMLMLAKHRSGSK